MFFIDLLFAFLLTTSTGRLYASNPGFCNGPYYQMPLPHRPQILVVKRMIHKQLAGPG